MIKSVLITGANAGLGKDSARQFALQSGIEKVYLGLPIGGPQIGHIDLDLL